MAREEKEKEKIDYAELHDMPRASIAEAREQIELSIKTKQRRGCFVLVGESGIGKTQVIEQIAEDHKMRVCTIRTAHYGLMGAGIPSTKSTTPGFFDIVVPSVFPNPGEKAIVLFDELNQGLQHAIAMFFSMLEDGQMFNYKLPEESIVLGTMNPATAQYAVTTIENNAALRRRIKFLYLHADFKGWMKHAKSPRFHGPNSSTVSRGKPCHPDILSYFVAKPTAIYDEGAKNNNKLYCCPAAIETLSADAYALQEAGQNLYSDMALLRYSASIGTARTAELVRHIQDNSTTIDPAVILTDFKKAEPAIRRLIENSMQEILADLDLNVLKILFSTTPPVKKAAANFVEFVQAHSDDMAYAMLTQMKRLAKENNAGDYLKTLMRELQEHPAWSALHMKFDASHRNYESKLKEKGDKTP
jgi:hypothetical protein